MGTTSDGPPLPLGSDSVMRVHLVFAHPTRRSLCGAILEAITDELQRSGHRFELTDLYAQSFNPVLSLVEWRNYEGSVDSDIAAHAEMIGRCDGLIWIFPTWNCGLPAILKGYLDRVWRPNIAFTIDDRRILHFDRFTNIRFFMTVTTYGSGWLANAAVGNPCRRVVTRCLKRHFPSSTKLMWLAIYRVDRTSDGRNGRFLERVRAAARSCLSRPEVD
jgi:putative NADPH-quinone reductase